MKNNLKMTKGTLKYSAMRVDIIKKIYLPYFEIIYHTPGGKILGPQPHCKFILMY